MNYRRDWANRAEQHLAALWLAAPDRSRITAAAAGLDRELDRDPLRFGTPLDSSVHRVGVFDILGVEFEVIEDDKRVIVHGVFAVG